MNTTHITTPDGRLLTIEGADARQVAAIIQNDYVHNLPQRQALTHNETPLEMPTLNFSPAALQPAAVESGETALALPSLM